MSRTATTRSLLFVLLGTAPLWALLINQLRIDWTVNAQYSYGWTVPLLCMYLLYRAKQRPDACLSAETRARVTPCEEKSAGQSGPLMVALLALAFIWLPTRLVQEANPDWRLLAWALALEAVALTILLIRFGLGSHGLAKCAFPVGFFLVAVPWPTAMESRVIQGLTRTCSSITSETLATLGIPAIQHGNVIEVGTGVVGIDEACSGVRSFQASLMIALFFGELYRLRTRQRTLCVLAGFALSFLFNLCRTTLLTFVASREGVAAISKWHDPAGVTILVGCFLSLWAFVVRFSRRAGMSSAAPEFSPPLLSRRGAAEGLRWFRISRLGPMLGLWVLFSELAVQGWYGLHELDLPPGAPWSVSCPDEKPNFKHLQVPEKARQMFRFNNAANFCWDEGGLHWQVIFLQWRPGRIAAHVARFHNPEVCLSATGRAHETVLERRYYQAGSLRLPFRVLRSEDKGRTMFLFYCIWEDRGTEQEPSVETINYKSRISRAISGQRNLGERALEVAISDALSFEEAETAFKGQLAFLIHPTTAKQVSIQSGRRPGTQTGS